MALILFSASALAESRLTVINYDIKGFEKQDTLVLRWGIVSNTSNPLIASHHALTHRADSFIIDEPRLLFITLKGREGVLELLVHPGEHVNIKGKLRRSYAAHYNRFDISTLKVTGAETQEEYISLISHLEHYRDSLSRVPEGYADISRRYNQAIAIGDVKAINAMRNGTYEEQNYLQMVGSNETEVVRYIINMVLTYRDTYMGPLLMLRLFEKVDERLRPVYQQFYPEAKRNYYGHLVRLQVLPKIQHDHIAPPLHVLTEKGDIDTLRFTDRHVRYTLVDFWASYCSPCLRQMPVLKSLYDKFHHKGLDIVTVSTDSDSPEWMKALNAQKFTWTTNYFDIKHEAPHLYKFDGIPYTLLIDEGGMIIAVDLHGVELSEYIESLFSE